MREFNIYRPAKVETGNGLEFGFYFQYLCHEYEHLSDYIFFVHGSEYSWHQNGSTTAQINRYLKQGVEHFTWMNIDHKGCWNDLVWNDKSIRIWRCGSIWVAKLRKTVLWYVCA
eukprot:UN02460